MRVILLSLVAAAAFLSVSPAFAQYYEEYRVVRDYDRWGPPRPWFRHFALGGCRVVTERRIRPNGTVVVRKIRDCD